MEKHKDKQNKTQKQKALPTAKNDTKHFKKRKRPYTMAMATRDLLHQSIADGSLKEKLEKISNSADIFKSAVTSFSQIVSKAQEQLENQPAQVSSDDNLSFLTEMWVPMFLNLIETSEFQGLMASMLVRMVN